MNMKAATAGVVILVFAALGAYVLQGDAKSIAKETAQVQPQSSAMRQVAATNSGNSLPTVDVMLKRLEGRLEREPGDADGWHLLGRSYEYLGQEEKAREAFVRAAELGYAGTAPETSKPRIVRGEIRLDPRLADSLSGDETVFIFARAASGPHVPLAVLRMPAGEFPIAFELDDALSMTADYRLSDYDQIIVGARVSASGDAAAGEGDLEGYSGILDVNSMDDVVITIDQAVLMPSVSAAGEG